jgi:DNA (cytosine-5)-methyltransferase 1
VIHTLDLFSGIGGFSLGLERAGGFQTVAFCEIDPFCRRVLAKHWPNVPCHDDVRTMEFPQADVITGGFPCQDVSRAGKRAGLSGERSGLYRELVRALRVVRPRYAIVENVAALLGDGMGTVLGDVAESGFDIEWDCIPAQALGAPHERDRVYIVAHANNGNVDAHEAISPRRNAAEFGLVALTDANSERRGEAGQLQHKRQAKRSARGAETQRPPDASCLGCGQGRAGRPPDSFAWIRDEARRNSTNPASEGLEGREQSEAARRARAISASGYRNPWRAWTDEPPLSGMDDGIRPRMDRDWAASVRATGNTILPQIPELIGRAILACVPYGD